MDTWTEVWRSGCLGFAQSPMEFFSESKTIDSNAEHHFYSIFSPKKFSTKFFNRKLEDIVETTAGIFCSEADIFLLLLLRNKLSENNLFAPQCFTNYIFRQTLFRKTFQHEKVSHDVLIAIFTNTLFNFCSNCEKPWARTKNIHPKSELNWYFGEKNFR